MKKSLILGMALLTAGAAQAVVVDFDDFYIRNSNSTIDAPWDSDLYVLENTEQDGFVASTPQGGQKVGYGTSAFHGFQLNDLQEVDWEKLSGPANLTAYLNIWVTDGTNYAVIASENDYRGENLSTYNEWKIFEYGPGSDFDWLFDSGDGTRSAQYLLRDGVNATLADLSDDIVVFAGPVGPTAGVGTGAPRAGYGFNIIWGDTAANFTIGNPYEVDDVVVKWDNLNYEAGDPNAPIPEPATMTLLGLGLAGLIARSRKRA
jgi:hypothetical protein